MPIKITSFSGSGQSYSSPFTGPIDHTAAIPILLTNFTSAEVDANGYLKPGVPIKYAAADTQGLPISATSQFVYGCVVEATKVADGNTSGQLTGKVVLVAVATKAQVRRAILEDILGRVLSANEIAAFDAAGSQTRLVH